ncbi:MAG: hypothetical protein JSU57_01140, partial [Candidatus Heimdallarchaeota archaeon]
MIIKIIPFFSSLSTKSTYNNVLSQLAIDENQIITPNHYLSKEYSYSLNDRHYLFVGTGGTENDIASFIQQSELKPPIILLSYDSNNSLPAAMEIRKYLDEQGIKTHIEHGTLEQLALTLQEWKQFVSIENKLKEIRIGVFGIPSEWLIASKVNEKAIEKVWGVKIIYIPISNLISFQNNEIPVKIGEIEKKFIKQATEFDVTQQAVKEAGLLKEKLLQFTKESQLNAITIECFSLLLETDITACYALSYLNDMNIIAGCEGDIPSAFTMLLVNLLTGQTPFMGNVVHVNEQENTIHLAHCTVPLGIIESYSITTHFESGKSIAIKGKFKIQQEVTILKIWGEDLTDHWVGEGKIVANLTSTSACRTQIELSLDEPVKYFLESSLANHHILILGKYKEKVTRFLNFFL